MQFNSKSILLKSVQMYFVKCSLLKLSLNHANKSKEQGKVCWDCKTWKNKIWKRTYNFNHLTFFIIFDAPTPCCGGAFDVTSCEPKSVLSSRILFFPFFFPKPSLVFHIHLCETQRQSVSIFQNANQDGPFTYIHSSFRAEKQEVTNSRSNLGGLYGSWVCRRGGKEEAD